MSNTSHRTLQAISIIILKSYLFNRAPPKLPRGGPREALPVRTDWYKPERPEWLGLYAEPVTAGECRPPLFLEQGRVDDGAFRGDNQRWPPAPLAVCAYRMSRNPPRRKTISMSGATARAKKANNK
jgi:hypothetical protein